MIKKIVLAVVAVSLVVGALVGTKISQFQAMGEAASAFRPPPLVVTSAIVERDEWEMTLTSVGTLTPVRRVTLSSETAGKIERINFDSGTAVSQGDVLVVLDTATEEAALRAAKAAASLARSNLKRTRELRKNATVSPAELDAAEAQFDEAQAQVESISTTIEKKTIRAPFSGRLGMRQVDPGEVLQEGDAITTLQALAQVYVDFSLPQQHLASLTLNLPIRITTDAAPGEIFSGTISAVSPEIDAATRNATLQGTVTNTGEKLRGGMFVNVDVVLPQREQVLRVPLTAVLFAPFGNSVFVIEKGEANNGETPPLVLRQRFVRIGTRRGDFVAVTAGLSQGEQIVTSGVFKLRTGTPVTIDNTRAPESQLRPTPSNG